MKLSNDDGASAVEFALVLPLLLVIVFGIIEFGLALYNKQMLTNASREGARAGIVSRSISPPRLPQADVEQIALDYCEDHLVTFGTPNTPQVLFPDGFNPSAVWGDSLKLRITYDYEFLFLPNFITSLAGTTTLGAETVMRYE